MFDKGGYKVQELSRREREKLSRRNEILQAARKVFSSKDYASATLDDIATVAELSKGTIYLYFQNKADLFLSTFEMGMEQVASVIMDAISDNKDDPISGVKDIIQRELLLFEENMDLFKIVTSESAHFDLHSEMGRNNDFKKRMIKEISQSIIALTDYIQNGIDMGLFKKVSPKDAASALLSIIRGFSFDWIMGLEEGSPRDKTEIIITIFLDGLRQKDCVTN
jgi:AcrR family transcriptional regulator